MTSGDLKCTLFFKSVLSLNLVTLQRNLDHDECSVDNGGCSHTCINTLGGHTCDCPDGYNMTQDSKTCTGLVHYHYTFLKYIHYI